MAKKANGKGRKTSGGAKKAGANTGRGWSTAHITSMKGSGGAKKAAVNMGRDGTITRFVREAIAAGKGIADVSKAACKKFDSDKINKGYVSWHRSQMRSAGMSV